jgi:hypothetical protein
VAAHFNSRLVLSTRPENLELLREYIRRWSREHRLDPARREYLEQAAVGVFRHLLEEAYNPHRPGSISLSLEDRGPRVRLVFEDDAPPFPPCNSNGNPATLAAAVPATLARSLPQVDSLVYYRTENDKNRLVLTVTL